MLHYEVSKILFFFKKSHCLHGCVYFCFQGELKLSIAFNFSFLHMQPMRLERWEASTEESLDMVCVQIYIFYF